MRRLLLSACTLLLGSSGLLLAQGYVDRFEGDDSFVSGTSALTATVEAGTLSIEGDGTSGAFETFSVGINDGSEATTFDFTANNTVFVRARASSIGTTLRLDVQDETGFLSTNAGRQVDLTTDFEVYEFDFTDRLFDGGFGGTPCDMASAPCDVDGTEIFNLVFYPDAGIGEFEGRIDIDYVALVEDPGSVRMSDIFQDHFDTDSSLVDLAVPDGGPYTTRLVDSTVIEITGDGTAGQFDAFGYIFRNPQTRDEIEIDFTEGDNKLYVRMKSTEPNTALRIDVQDFNSFLSTGASITKIVSDEWAEYEFDFTGGYTDLGFGGTPCTQASAPCDVNAERIANLIMFIDPGVGNFAGTLSIDYISVGTSLQPPLPPADLVYSDRFNDDTVRFVTTPVGYTTSEVNSEWTISGDGAAGPFASVLYAFHDVDSMEQITIDMEPARNQLFVRMRTDGSDEPVRIDVIDTVGRVSSQTSVTKVVSGDYATYTYDFTGAQDGGFSNNAACMSANAPCPVDLTAISQLLFSIRAADGGYDGDLIIDYIAVGRELDPDSGSGPTGVVNYRDDLDQVSLDSLFLPGGYSASFEDGALSIEGDGTAGPFAAIVHNFYNEDLNPLNADLVNSGDTLFVRARATEPVDLRIDLVDNMNFITSQDAVTVNVGTEYVEHAFVFRNYLDGGFGGTACTQGPCDVDGTRVAKLFLSLDPTTGGYDGRLDIDYFSFGRTVSSARDLSDAVTATRVFPNPTEQAVTVAYSLLRAGEVAVRTYDMFGRLVATELAERQSAGKRRRDVSLDDLATGTYLVQVVVDGLPASSVRVVKR